VADRPPPTPLRETRTDLPPELDALVARFMTPDPAGRPASAAAAAQLLEPFAAGADLPELLRLARTGETPGPTRLLAPPTVTPPARPPSRRRTRVAVAAGLLAGVAAVAALLLIGGDRNPVVAEPSPAPAPQGDPRPAPRPAAPGEWTGLLKTRPAARVWKAGVGTLIDHDAAKETLFFQNFTPALIPLGQTGARGYRLQVSFRQVPWTGGFGVYFGGRDEGAGPDRFWFQVIDLRQFQPATGRPFSVVRETGEVVLRDGAPFVPLHGFASTIPTRPLGNKEATMELEVEPRGLIKVGWNGDLCLNLTTNAANDRVGPGDYAGEFGIYSYAGATFVSAARFTPTH
jgi:hypothetical protein